MGLARGRSATLKKSRSHESKEPPAIKLSVFLVVTAFKPSRRTQVRRVLHRTVSIGQRRSPYLLRIANKWRAPRMNNVSPDAAGVAITGSSILFTASS